jgi:hypothetical protein
VRSANLRQLCSAALACALLAGCATTLESSVPPPGAATVPAPTVSEGDFWEYAVRDAYTGAPRGLHRYTVSHADADRVWVDVTRDGERIDTRVYSHDWKGLEHPLRNIQRFRYAPAYPAYAFPLYPGQSWRGVVNATDTETGRSYRTHVHASVGGWHRIKVPAGEFDALEVKRYVYAGNAEFFKSQEEIVETEWYAPSLGHAVASVGTSSHVDTSRSAGGRGRPLRVRGDWLVAELVRHSAR